MNKKIFIIAALVLCYVQSYAQLSWNPEPSSEPRPYGITIGFTGKNISGKGLPQTMAWGSTQTEKIDKIGEGFRIGFTYNPEFSYGIGLLMGVYYELTPSFYTNTFKTIDNRNLKTKMSVTSHEISIPLRLQWRYELMEDVSVFAYTGPSFDFGLNYTEKWSLYQDGTRLGTYKRHVYNGKWKRSIDVKDADEDLLLTYLGGSEDGSDKSENYKTMRRFHPMWGFGLGFQWKFLRLEYYGDWGLMNISNVSSESRFQLNKPLNFSLSVMF